VDRREFKDLDGNVELGIPQHQERAAPAKFARTARPTISTSIPPFRESANHGYIDVHMRPERRTR